MAAQEPPVPPTMAHEFTMAHERLSDNRERVSMTSSRSKSSMKGFKVGLGLQNVARRTLGIFLLLVTVFLWTASNFLASVRCS